MLDHESVGQRLDRLEVAQAQNFQLVNTRLERIETKLDMLVEQATWITRVLQRRFAGPDALHEQFGE